MSKASDHAYKIVRASILEGSLAPGTQITEEDIASLCGVSRTPVREAMQRLESDMFLERNDAKRTFVSDWSNESISHVFELRTMLEAHVAERAAAAMTDALLAELIECNETISVAIKRDEPDVDCFLRENFKFHRLLLQAAGSQILITMVSRLVLVPIVQQTAQHYTRQQLEQSLSDHEQLIAAFELRDAKWAGAIMTSHLQRARHVYFSTRNNFFENKQDDG